MLKMNIGLNRKYPGIACFGGRKMLKQSKLNCRRSGNYPLKTFYLVLLHNIVWLNPTEPEKLFEPFYLDLSSLMNLGHELMSAILTNFTGFVRI